MKRTHWTTEQVEILCRHYADSRTEDVAFIVGRDVKSVYLKAHALGLAKSAAYLASPAACRLNRGTNNTATQFKPGLTPWNKGMKGLRIGGKVTQFKPGQAPSNTMPIGSTKFDKSGVLLQKVRNATGNNSQRWRAVHELVWVATNGPVPRGHLVVFKPGMRTTVLDEITLDRVECISRAENMKRNTRHNLPPELNEVVQLRAVLTRQINKRINHGQEKH